MATRTGGYAYDRRLLELLPAHGLAVRHLRLPGSFPFASVADLSESYYRLRTTPPDAVLLIDGLAYGALTDLVLKDVDRTMVALVHHPLALETGLNDRQQRALRHSETAALARAARVIVTSPTTAAILASDYGVAPERIAVAEPGTDRAPIARGSVSGGAMLAVGAVSPRKGYGVLVEALAALRDLDWSLVIVGSLERAPEEAARLADAVREHGLSERIRLAGELDEAALAAAWDEADLFVAPSLFEGYGMVLGEAMARGLPIVCTTGGAASATAPDDAALKVTPGDAPALAAALRRVLGDAALRRRMAEASRLAGERLPRWDDTARIVADALRLAKAEAAR
nr:glycosyltransferase family 4 protein [Alsobacter ponti]